MKKILIFLPLLFLFSACTTTPANMDEQAEDGNYHYENRDLRFSVLLPPEFEYYQTQRIEQSGWVDIEFFLPTKDPVYVEEAFPSYFKPLVIRVWAEPVYETATEAQKEDNTEFGRQNDQVYTYRFADEIPQDWTERFNDELKQFVSDNLKLE